MNDSTSIIGLSLTKRRVRNSIVTFVLLALLCVVVYAQKQTLLHASFTTGYLLMGCIVFLGSVQPT